MRRTKPVGAYVGTEDKFQRTAIDLVRRVAAPKGVDHKVGLALELKVWPNKPTEAQLSIHDLLRKAGWKVVVAYGIGDVEQAVKEYLR